MTKFTLPISPSYVSHWGLWEAVRELYQNALDADPGATIELDDETLYITSTSPQLQPATLILGNTTKADDPSKRGKFGEGYKLALLVLCRLGLRVDIRNGSDDWNPMIEPDEAFESDVLNIYVSPRGDDDGTVQFVIHGVLDEDFDAIMRNIIEPPTEDTILNSTSEMGRVYVGGLYVCTVPKFLHGYSLTPGSLPLDRDRGMVSNFDLSFLTSQLWTAHDDNDRAVELLELKAPDVQYVTSHATSSSPVIRRLASAFRAKHGDAVPVVTQQEIERATAAGVCWVLVPEAVKGLLGRVLSWFVPSTKTPVERLRDFRKQHRYSMSEDMLTELDDIIKSMSDVKEPS